MLRRLTHMTRLAGPTMLNRERPDIHADVLIGESPSIATIRAEMADAAKSDAKVLLTGESGAGKDIVARLIHQRSRRSHMPLVTINCVSVPDSLLEAELFGHVRGSFTGAYRDRAGLFELANHGTVFLDEVCEMTPRMQALLLRFLESGEIQRVGADQVQTRLDVRVIAATNRDPTLLVAAKTFREDLYYRLNVIDITIPPLRDRREDIPRLFEYFLDRYAVRHRLPRPALGRDALDVLVAHKWPGNVRQLKNVAERLIVRTRNAVIGIADLPPDISGAVRALVDIKAGVDHGTAELLYDRMVNNGESFWSIVYPAFMTRDLTREDLRYIIARGLRQTSGNYKILVELLNMDGGDYKRFLNFLRKHECQVPFERFRSSRSRPQTDTSAFPLRDGGVATLQPLAVNEPEETIART
jgi:transcriptional regulator with PAS, ATPase and Fis domain